jgi:hypothetical protein
MPRRLTLRGRRDVTGGWEETLACLSGRCAGAYRASLRVRGITRRARRGKAEMTSDDAMRASDGDREHAAEMLRNAYAAGRIDLEELHDRAGAAYSATTRGDLRDLTADLPTGQVRSCAASGAESLAGAAEPGHAPRRRPVLRTPEAAPTKAGGAARIAMVTSGAKIAPMPSPATSSTGRT